MSSKLLSFQPCSIYQNGGCGRVLRRLYEGKEKDVISIEINTYKHEIFKGPIQEKNIFLYPAQKKWMRWKLRNINAFIQQKILLNLTKRKIRTTISKYQYDIIHTINQGILSAYLCQEKYIKGKQLWVSFHDHYSIGSTFNDAKKLWQTANRRLVISEKLAEEYSAQFGKMDYEIITDGLKAEEISAPKNKISNPLIVYFGGLLHHDYLPLFKAFSDALNKIVKKNNLDVKLILRGVANVSFLNNQLFTIEYRNNFVSDVEIKNELDGADILYLPLKFTVPDFFLYSMSTKMIGYLGASGKIFYHGPKNSALCSLLSNANAAICCTSLETKNVINDVERLFNNSEKISQNAKELAFRDFQLSRIQTNFWKGF